MSDTPDEAPMPKDMGEEMHDEGDEPTALIPKALLAGKDFKPGEEVVLQIVRIHDDEVEVKYATEKGGDGEYSEPKSSDPEMASLMED